MEDRFNTIAGWTLFSGIVALGLASISAHHFGANKPERPEKMGFPIAGVVSSSEGAVEEVPIETLLASADPAKGEAVFKKCASCHTVNQGGANGIGPNLYGVVGDHVGEGRGGFAFSDDLKKHGGTWDFKSLNEWLTNPKGMVSGTKMTFAGLESGPDRANLIAYLNTQGSNLPLPKAAPAADAKAAEGGKTDGKAAADAAAKPAEGAAAPAAAATAGTPPAH